MYVLDQIALHYVCIDSDVMLLCYCTLQTGSFGAAHMNIAPDDDSPQSMKSMKLSKIPTVQHGILSDLELDMMMASNHWPLQVGHRCFTMDTERITGATL